MKAFGLFLVLMFLGGCVSPELLINKNMTVNIITEKDVTVVYSTSSDLDTVIDFVQDIKPTTKLTPR